MKSVQTKPRRCTYCGQQAPLVWVHGHGQCASCGINIEECCQGEQCEMEIRVRPKDEKGYSTE